MEKDLAQCILKRFGTNNPIEIAKELGIIVLYENLGSIKGYFNIVRKQKFIHINCDLQDHEVKFTAAHELGHALMHAKQSAAFLRQHTYFAINKMEISANLFAVNLLISDSDINECKGHTYNEMASLFGCSEDMIKLRLKKHPFV